MASSRLTNVYRICIFVAFSLYIMSGREIFRKRAELRALRQPSRVSVEEPFSGSKTTEVSVTSELAGFRNLEPPVNCFDNANATHNATTSPRGYEQYSTTIDSSPPSIAVDPSPRISSQSASASKRYNTALEANTAAWRYTKVALLFFVSLCVTWFPSSINRIYDLAHPTSVSYPLNFISAIVLPLMGFWNGVIYFATTRAVCNAIFWELVEKWAPRKKPTLTRSASSLKRVGQARDIRRSKGSEGSMTESLTGFANEERRGGEMV